jgi:transcriptional regulator with XRE-family HTH domain
VSSFWFGSMLKAARERAGINQAEQARRMGISASAVNRIESGKRPVCEDTIARYAEALGARVVFELVGVVEGDKPARKANFDRRRAAAALIG